MIATNQSGIGRGLYTEEDFYRLTDWMKEQFAAAGAPLAGVYFCPHHPTDAVGPYRTACDCRKPRPGMLLAAARDLGIDLSRSVVFGDRESDLVAGRAAGVPERLLLWADGTQAPLAAPAAGLATGTYRTLAAAVAEAEAARA